MRTWTIRRDEQQQKIICQARCCARVLAQHGQIVPAMRLREGALEGRSCRGRLRAVSGKSTQSLPNGPPLVRQNSWRPGDPDEDVTCYRISCARTGLFCRARPKVSVSGKQKHEAYLW